MPSRKDGSPKASGKVEGINIDQSSPTPKSRRVPGTICSRDCTVLYSSELRIYEWHRLIQSLQTALIHSAKVNPSGHVTRRPILLVRTSNRSQVHLEDLAPKFQRQSRNCHSLFQPCEFMPVHALLLRRLHLF
jgi:hypothetical protein